MKVRLLCKTYKQNSRNITQNDVRKKYMLLLIIHLGLRRYKSITRRLIPSIEFEAAKKVSRNTKTTLTEILSRDKKLGEIKQTVEKLSETSSKSC